MGRGDKGVCQEGKGTRKGIKEGETRGKDSREREEDSRDLF